MAEQQESTPSMSFSMKTTVYGIKMKFPSVENISCKELEHWKNEKKNLICLDTRPVEEYRISHLPGSVRVDPDATPNLKELGISADSTVVCYCSVGYRSSSMAQKLFKEHKHSEENASQKPLQVYNLEGGVFQWACEGRDMVNPEGEAVTTVHPYSSFWGKLLPQNLRHKL